MKVVVFFCTRRLHAHDEHEGHATQRLGVLPCCELWAVPPSITQMPLLFKCSWSVDVQIGTRTGICLNAPCHRAFGCTIIVYIPAQILLEVRKKGGKGPPKRYRTGGLPPACNRGYCLNRLFF